MRTRTTTSTGPWTRWRTPSPSIAGRWTMAWNATSSADPSSRSSGASTDDHGSGDFGTRRRARAWRGAPRRVSLLRRAAAAHLRRSRDVAAVRVVSAGRPAERHGALLSPARIRVRSVFPRAAAGIRAAGSPLHGIRLLLVVFAELARPCPSLHGQNDRGARSIRREPRDRGREQRRLSAPVLRGTRHSGARHRARRECRRDRDYQRGADAPQVLRA